MNDRTAEEFHQQLLLNAVREGADPNDSEDEQEIEGYHVPEWNAKKAAALSAEISVRAKELHKERLQQLKTLRSNAQHKSLPPFERVIAEAELWTGQQSMPADAGKKGANKSRRGGGSYADEEDLSQADGGETERLTTTPSYLRGKLRPYQLEGVSWLLQLTDRNINGILADEMGLGKTFQTIALLAYLKYTRGLPGPHLVVAPKSVLGNWFREFKKWCPTLTVYKFHGGNDIRSQLVTAHLKPPVKYDVIITTFEMIVKEVAAFKRINWRYLVIDEAHKLKNSETVAHKSLDGLPTEHRLLVTGTPLQNDLKELWSLLHFLAPELFNESEHFVEWFDSATGEQDANAVSRMHLILAPLMLRRLKSEAAKELPPKKEIYVGCKLTKLQRDWYLSVLAKDADALNRGNGSTQRLANVVMQLRKVCNHPFLFPPADENPNKTDDRIIKASGKMMILDKLLVKLRSDPKEKHKVLIFSQMTRMLDIMEDYLTMRGYKYFRIDGSTSGLDRDTQMAQFNNPASDYFIFLLSTRSGGLGINLQTANHVVLYDSDWNPQMDLQAQDRAHRIGQKRPVRVYRFITDKTFEERIYRRALKKLYLDAMVVEQGRLAKQHTKASKEELMSMIKFGVADVWQSGSDAVMKEGDEITDADVEKLLASGEQHLNDLQNEMKKEQQTSLATFKLGIDESNTYDFEGINFQTNTFSKTVYVQLPEPMSEEEIRSHTAKFGEIQKVSAHPNGKAALIIYRTQAGATDCVKNLEWKAIYAVKEEGRIISDEIIDIGFSVGENRNRRQRGALEAVDEKQLAEMQAAPARVPLKLPKPPQFPPHQLFNMKRLKEIYDTEVSLLVAKWKKQGEMQRRVNQGASPLPEGETFDEEDYELNADEQNEREQLMTEGFPQWTYRDFCSFRNAVSKVDPTDYAGVAAQMNCGKSEGEVRDYSHAFWGKGQVLAPKLYEEVERRTQKIREKLKKHEETKAALRWKLEQYENPSDELKLPRWRHNEKLERTIFFTAYDNDMDCAGLPEKVMALPENRFDIFYKTRNVHYYEAKVRAAVNAIVTEKKDHDHGGTGWRIKRKREREPVDGQSPDGRSPNGQSPEPDDIPPLPGKSMSKAASASPADGDDSPPKN